MFSKKIAYKCLRHKLIDENLSISDIARQLGMNRDTLSKKLAREQPIKLCEAFLIQQTFFPDTDVEELFQESMPNYINSPS